MSCHFEQHEFCESNTEVSACFCGYVGKHFKSLVCVTYKDYGKHMTNQNGFETMT